MSRRQLLALGFGPQAIKHRVARGRLHPVRRGVYALGRPELTRHGRWMAAVLGCGPGAVLSHGSAAALWLIGSEGRGEIEISVPKHRTARSPGVRVHRRQLAAAELTERAAIPVTSVTTTIVDLAARGPRHRVEAAINEADVQDLIDPESLRAGIDALTRRPGLLAARHVLDRRTFAMTRSELERRFLPLVREVGLPSPETQVLLNGFEVDFYWPVLGLVVETDGLRYHRTPAQQARDRLRDQTHAAAGLTPLRFTHGQIKYRPGHVLQILAAVTARLR